MKRQITVANLVMGAGGLVTFLFSFFRFVSVEGLGGFSAWSSDGLAFASTVPAILGLAMVVWVVLELLGVTLPAAVLTYTPTQLKGTWGIAAAGIMLSWTTANDNKGFGFWMMLIGSLAMGVGAVMALLGKGTELVDIPVGVGDDTSTPPPPPPPSAPMPPPPPPSN